MASLPVASRSHPLKRGGPGRGSPSASRGLCSLHANLSRSRSRLVGNRDVSVHRFVEALVVERAGHRRELLAKLTRVGGRLVGVERAAVLPDLGDGEMVQTVRLLQHLI